MSHIILASASPRRKELLEQVKLTFQIRVSSCEEVITKTIPYEIVMELSEQKATDISSHLTDSEKEDCIVIGADTIVAYEDQILGKPSSPENAYAMLRLLSGNIHQVYTGVTLIKYENGICQKKTFYEKTDVYFYPLTDEKIHTYIASGNCMDKAGAYGIQCEAAAFVQKIDGDYNNVVGLPIARLLKEMEQF
ncbi:MAG: septum formation inhibitor Maf [Lachnospiraceae bacterium]|nr:septum formation inhibitor Maf [Lachnospiraceae bacterium]